MEHYAGIDVSLECSSVCVVDATGRIVREAKVASEPEALIAWFGRSGSALARIGLEAGPLSQWLYAAMREAGLAVELLETRHVRDAFKAMPVKTDRNDARGIAQLMRLGWFRPVHCKSLPAQETRALLTARKLLQIEAARRRDEPARDPARLRAEGRARRRAKLSRRGSANWWPGIRAWRRSPRRCWRRARCCCASSTVSRSACASMARDDASARLLMSTPAVGPIVALTYVAAIDDPARFRSSKTVGAHFGLTPKKYQSGETDVTGRISKIGDAGVRAALYEAAHVILTQPVKGCRPEELGDAPRQARRHAQGQGGAGAQARRDPASHAGRRHAVHPAPNASLAAAAA